MTALTHVDLLPADGDSRLVRLDDKTGHALVDRRVGVGDGKDENPVGMARVGANVSDTRMAVCSHPHLGAINDPVVAFLLGPGLDRGNVRTGAGLSLG